MPIYKVFELEKEAKEREGYKEVPGLLPGYHPLLIVYCPKCGAKHGFQSGKGLFKFKK